MNSGQLFSEHFLTEGIRATAAYQRITDTAIRQLCARLVAAFDSFPTCQQPDEASTEQDLIFRVLESLGWNRDGWQVQPRASRRGRSDVPDVLLFPDATAKQQAMAEPSSDRRFRHGIAIVENKRWDRPLDRVGAGARAAADEREVPSTQVLRYLSRADILSERRIQFAILTNGRLWRLYYQGARSRSEQYLEIDLPSFIPLTTIPLDLRAPRGTEQEHWLRVFLLMFGRESFVSVEDGGRSFHLLALDEVACGRRPLLATYRDLYSVKFFRLS